MCWSGEASATIAVLGFSSAYYLKRRGEAKEIYLPTAYFVLMEGLQALTYLVVDDCGGTANTLFTRLAIVHISFQPFFINMLGMEFIDRDVKERIKTPVYLLCLAVTAFCLMRLAPYYDTLGRCEEGTALCSHIQNCAYRGEWHIGWDVLLNGFNEHWNWYMFGAFAVPVIYGSWKWALYHALVGPILAGLTTADVNERPAVWCLFSTCIIAMLVNTRLRNYVYVQKWPVWSRMRRLGTTPTALE